MLWNTSRRTSERTWHPLRPTGLVGYASSIWPALLGRSGGRLQLQHVDSSERCCAASLDREFSVLDRWCQVEQPPQDLLGLDPGERGAGAEVRTVAERQVRWWLPAQVQEVGVSEGGRVTVGCAEGHEHVLALSDSHFAERHVASRYPGG